MSQRIPPKKLPYGTVIGDLVIETDEEGDVTLPAAMLTSSGTWMGVTDTGMQWTDIAADQIIAWKPATVTVESPGDRS
ncbi:hypothetical protein GCM10009720_16440 [Yaniella flava]|uniref:Uncharacterized protein n=1 Tax=Yaniella flava TaxID=287930 RepID=A0ABN2UHD9_9MICC|nr:hypothetical protein [Micrococcaceae bacterium]